VSDGTAAERESSDLLRRFADADALRARGLFAAEGRFVVERMLETGRYEPVVIAVTPATREAIAPLLGRAPGAPVVIELPARDLQALVGYPLDRGCVAIVRRPSPGALDAVLASASGPGATWLVLHDVSNPDNVGSVFRSAAAFGARGVVLAGGCADPLYRKTVRTSLGNTLVTPYAQVESAQVAFEALQRASIRSAALVARGGEPLHAWRPPPAVALWLGHEGAGLPDAVAARCHQQVTISMAGAVDSLNVAVAGAIALHHVVTARSWSDDSGITAAEGA